MTHEYRQKWLDWMQNNDSEFQDLPSDLFGDREFILEAVKQNVTILRFASEPLRNDPKIAMTAIRYHKGASSHVGSQLLDDKEFMLDFVKESEWVLITHQQDFKRIGRSF